MNTTVKISVLFFLIFQFTPAYCQKLEKEALLKEADKDRGLGYVIRNGQHISPPVIDLGENGFIINPGKNFIKFSNNLEKSWETPSKTNPRTTKGFAVMMNYYTVANHTTFYEIDPYTGYNGEPIEFLVAAYNLSDGKAISKNFVFQAVSGVYITDIFALEDGLYYLKAQRDKKAKQVNHYLGKFDLASGTFNEIKVDLPYSAEELKEQFSYSLEDDIKRYLWKKSEVRGDKIFLMKGYEMVNSRTRKAEMRITLGTLEKNGQFSSFVNNVITQGPGYDTFTQPYAVVDTINWRIYVGGHTMKGLYINGIYLYSHTLSNKQDLNKLYLYDELNTSLKLTPKLIPVTYHSAGANNPSGAKNYLADLKADVYNGMVRYDLITNWDLTGRHSSYLYIDSKGDIVKAVKIDKTKGRMPEIKILYDSGMRKYKTGEDFFEENYPDDNKDVRAFNLPRKDYNILIEMFETKSRIKGFRLGLN